MGCSQARLAADKRSVACECITGTAARRIKYSELELGSTRTKGGAQKTG